jgi:kanamycin kinase
MSLPEELGELTDGYRFERHPYDETGAEIHRLTADGRPTLYLKAYPVRWRRLERETKVLRWIDGRLPAPKPLFYLAQGWWEYQLTTEVPGTPSYQLERHERENAVRLVAEALRTIHELDARGCPYMNTAVNRISEARSSKDSETHRALDRLEVYMPDEDLVFTHGDYCLPNIILKDGALSGVIDWDHAGISDPYADLEACMWSIGYNYGEDTEKLKQPFLREYGLEEPDEAKLQWYTRLSDLTP